MKTYVVILLVLLALLAAVPVASAEAGCPPGFHPHTEGDMHMGDHQHVGLSMESVDMNGNGVICVRHVGQAGNIHVHIDDNLR